MTELKFARDGDAEKAGVAEMTLDEMKAAPAAKYRVRTYARRMAMPT